jgi:hypothetical protein
MARYLLKEWGADPWGPVTSAKHETKSRLYLPVHQAALLGKHAMVRFFIEECDIPVDTVTPFALETPLHLACICRENEEDEVLRIVRFLVEQKGANVALRNSVGWTAAEIALTKGKQQIQDPGVLDTEREQN